MKIVYIGYNIHAIHEKIKKGDFSSQLLYGAIELEKKGLTIAYYSQSKKGLMGLIRDIIHLKKEKSDFLFFPYLNGIFYILLAIAKKTGFLKHEKLIGILHFTPSITNKNRLYIKSIYKVFNKVYFHSPKNMEECIKLNIVNRSQAEILYWGTDLSYLDGLQQNEKEKGTFISTGLENRDYKTLIDAFSSLPPHLHLDIYVYAQKRLQERKTGNIHINHILPENSNQYDTALKTKAAQCVVVPINETGLKYCTGHTSIVEAMALGKPVIVTDNPYHPIDVEKESIGIKVKPYDIESWKQAILYASTHKAEMIEMGKRGRRLAESTYNINNCAEQIYSYIITTK